MNLDKIKEADSSYSTISGMTLPLDPGRYIIMEEATWEGIQVAVKSGRSLEHIPMLHVDLRDSQVVEPCEKCGAYFIHEAGCTNG